MMLLSRFADLYDPSQDGLPATSLTTSTLKTILTLVFSTTGAIALLIVTIAGFRYILSQGNPQTISKAKNTIIYAGIGLVISIMAVTIVNFVIGRLI